MRAFLACIRKEGLELLRSGRLLILLLIFVFLGILSPATAKLTPWLLETMAGSLAGSGITVHAVNVTALDSWMQFFKNIPLGLIAFILLESGIFTGEYQSGTLILSLTKGLDRRTVLLSKAVMLCALWTLCYWLCFGVTYAYSAFYWDNAVARHLLLSAVCWWLFGLWVTALTVFFSAAAKTGTAVLAGTGVCVLVSVMLGTLPKLKAYLPSFLTDGYSLVSGLAAPREFLPAALITLALGILALAFSFPVFSKRQL